MYFYGRRKAKEKKRKQTIKTKTIKKLNTKRYMQKDQKCQSNFVVFTTDDVVIKCIKLKLFFDPSSFIQWCSFRYLRQLTKRLILILTRFIAFYACFNLVTRVGLP